LLVVKPGTKLLPGAGIFKPQIGFDLGNYHI